MSQSKLGSKQATVVPISKALRNKLSKDHACYVLITCSHPDEKGRMNVEMTYEGDSCLAAMLIENAQSYLQDDALSKDAH
jgi:hypothetical protein